MLKNLLPLILLFILPILSSIFSPSDTMPSGPEVRYAPEPPYTVQRTTPNYSFDFYVSQQDIDDYTPKILKQLARSVERKKINELQLQCQGERQQKARLINQAQGWFLPDTEKLREAHRLEMRHCEQLSSLNIPYESPY